MDIGVLIGHSELMIEPPPRWAKLFVGALEVALVALGLRMALDDGLGTPVRAESRTTTWSMRGTPG